MSSIVEASDLRVHFPTAGGAETVKAVDGVSFAVTRGETFGVIGESGSGKSTLGRAVVCLLKPTAGGIKLDATDPYALSGAAFRKNRRDFQIVFQDPNAALNPRMRIRDSVREPLDILGEGTRAERNARAVAVLDRVGLRAEFAERYPHELSGGQKQRVNIARVLTLRPELLVCDEVVAALDVSIQADILNLFADLQREFGLTYLFITHDLGVVESTASATASPSCISASSWSLALPKTSPNGRCTPTPKRCCRPSRHRFRRICGRQSASSCKARFRARSRRRPAAASAPAAPSRRNCALRPSPSGANSSPAVSLPATSRAKSRQKGGNNHDDTA